ncbi:MAG: ADP-ribosylglycohydrolase family protein [Chloroflexi bacterium]|uniref:ADP-ribosylglycohydrolase family protein n=1 Tax=Candidatus Chlorohelix allophototropha TaxID=3003348 RepID=A0A8T7MAX5_9CHLR|nr:ADP-ribosylglycohydrolase family protein [Chloroflexota bacterium]NWJ49186.1 ADP-ribosylglycohydrolase family protein [Chloroflexota bacterium]WJW69469.1 ADP-ribosylglycohydrolase family protein [Chloroflexota bacterium L227-S17]
MLTSQTNLEYRFLGCLLGGAVGDALGFTTENLSPQRIKTKYGRLTEYKVRPGRGYFTDDTQLTIALAETLLEGQGFQSRIFKRKLARWWLVPPRLSGRSIKNASFKCLLGLKNTGSNRPGSGSAMRSAPLALYYYNQESTLFDMTVECSRITHTHPAAIAGALVSTFSIAYCLTHSQLNRQEYLHKIAGVAEQFDKTMSKNLLALEEMLGQPEEEALKELLKNSRATGSPVGDVMMTAVYAFLKHPTDFEQSVLLCVNAGWDTDTMAAINGNISGAFNGVKSIPESWVKGLENGYKGRDYLLELGKSLHSHTSQVKKPNLLFATVHN